MWCRKLGFDVCPGAGSAWGGHAYLSVARLHSDAASGAGCHPAKCILPIVVPAATTATMLLTCHGMIDVAPLYVFTAVTGRGWDAGVETPQSWSRARALDLALAKVLNLYLHFFMLEERRSSVQMLY